MQGWFKGALVARVAPVGMTEKKASRDAKRQLGLWEGGDGAAGAVDADGVAIFEGGHTVADGHDRGNLHFAGGDGAVGKRAAGFGDYGDGVVEERGPGGVGGASDEDGAFGEGGEVVEGADEEDGASGLAGASGKAGEGSGARRSFGGAQGRLALSGPFLRPGKLKTGHYKTGRGDGARFVQGPGGGALAIAEISFFFSANGFAEGAPLLVVVGEDSFFEIGGASEEDVHGIADDAADVETAAEFAEPAAERKSEASGLVVLEIVKAGEGAGETDDFVEEEMEVGGEALEEFDFGFVHVEAEFVFPLRRRDRARGDGGSGWRTRPLG